MILEKIKNFWKSKPEVHEKIEHLEYARVLKKNGFQRGSIYENIESIPMQVNWTHGDISINVYPNTKYILIRHIQDPHFTSFHDYETGRDGTLEDILIALKVMYG